MTKKATKKGHAMSLKDFYESAPGQLPLETRLPSKPGELKRDNDAAQSFANLTLEEVPSSGFKGKNGISQHYGRVSNGYIGVGNGYDQYVRARPNADSFGHSPQPYSQLTKPYQAAEPYRYRTGYQDVADQQYSRAFYMQPPPPPPPRRQPSPPPSNRQPSPPRRQPSPPPRKQSATQIKSKAEVSAVSKPSSSIYQQPQRSPKEAAVEVVPAAGTGTSPKQAPQLASNSGEVQNATPKNDFAEKMAQQALERLASSKSSLLAGPLASTAAQPAKQRAPLAEQGEVGVFIKSDHPFVPPPSALKPCSLPTAENGDCADDLTNSAKEPSNPERPKLNLQPRTKAIELTESAKEAGRPRINIQPRAKPLADTANKKDSSGSKARGIFGEARPREEVLKERGFEAVEPERLDRISHGSYNTSNSRPSSRAASVGSGFSEDESWHTVSSRKPSKLQQANGVGDVPLVEDLFFTSTKPVAFSRPSGPQVYHNDGFHGTFGSPASEGQDDDGLFFRRSLPTRAGTFF